MIALHSGHFAISIVSPFLRAAAVIFSAFLSAWSVHRTSSDGNPCLKTAPAWSRKMQSVLPSANHLLVEAEWSGRARENDAADRRAVPTFD